MTTVSAPNLDNATGLQAIAILMQRYPVLWNQFKDHPDVLKVITDAAAQGWPPDRFQQALQNTDYWHGRTEAQRDWDALAATDPAEANRRTSGTVQSVANIMSRLGLVRPGDHASQTSAFLHDVYDITSQGLTQQQAEDYLMSKYKNPNPNQSTGEIATNLGIIRGLQADYALPHSVDTAYTMAADLAAGHITQDTIKGNLAEQASQLYGGQVAEAIRQGKTVRQWADPYVSLAAQNLEVGADRIDLSKPKWQAFLQQPVNPAKGADQATQPGTRPMTLAEWQAKIRTDPTYGFSKTSNAKQTAAQLASTLDQRFGASG